MRWGGPVGFTIERERDMANMREESGSAPAGSPWGNSNRREFLRLAATATAAVAAAGSLTGCVITAAGRQKLDFHDDFGVLNYAYALETLEAKFYERVVAAPPADLKPGELQILRDIGAHEIEHRRFFKRALGILAAHIPAVNFDGIDFTSREGVLRQARTFEDLGVAAYNGAGDRLKLAEFLTIAGKIVSVEARHASTIRDLLNPGSRDFAGDDVVDEQGLDRALDPGQVLAMASRYFATPMSVAGL
ncbi:MAG: hypothetical protein NVS4B3_28810 [Gemmatimonadaceae bacterium]